MDCLYKTTTNYNYNEYKRYTWSLLMKRSRIIWFVLLELWLVVGGWMIKNNYFIIFAVIYPILLFILQNRQIRKVYNSNKVTQNINVNFEFYDTYFTETTENGETKLEYNKLYKIIETKTNFYLMIAKNQGFILNKERLPDGLADFLREIKI